MLVPRLECAEGGEFGFDTRPVGRRRLHVRALDNPVAVDDERCPVVRKLPFIDVYAEQLDKLMPEVAEKKDVVVRVTPLLEGLLGRGMIGAYADDLGPERIKFCDVLRVSADLTFARSGEALGEEEQDDRLSPVVTDGMHLAIGPHEGKVRGGITYVNHCLVLVRNELNRNGVESAPFRGRPEDLRGCWSVDWLAGVLPRSRSAFHDLHVRETHVVENLGGE